MSLEGQLVGGRYLVGPVVGRGGHSVVHRALDRVTGDEVALKVLHDGMASSSEFAVRLVRELRASATLSETATIRVHGVTATRQGALCLVMELLEGLDLDDLLAATEERGERASVESLIMWLGPIVDTLERAHRVGIVHRDLKPGNVFILSDELGGGTRLLDFGLAHLPGSTTITRDGMIIGSPSYIAPEVWAGRPALLDHRVDVYALGAIVFRVLGGRVPFAGETIREKIAAITRGARPRLTVLHPGAPPELDAWVAKALAIEPGDRYQGVQQLWSALVDALDP